MKEKVTDKDVFTLEELGNAMLEDAKVDTDMLTIPKELWIQIATLLIQTDKQLQEIEQFMDTIIAENAKED